MDPIKGGYYPSGAENVDIPTQYFTHIFYAFLNPEDGTFEFKIDDHQAALLQTFRDNLHAKCHSIKVLFAVGGGDSTKAQVLSRMASEHTYREKFIKSSISVARKFRFDGIDLDWEYPQNPTDMENLGTLLTEWRVAVNEEADLTGQTALLLTAAVYYTTTITCTRWPNYTGSYPVSTMSTKLDFINVMTYDYHGSWEPNITGAFAALYDPKSSVSTDAGINSWMTAGAPPEKLIMGLPLYGRTWKLEYPTRADGIGAPANGVGPGTDGVMTYAQVVINKANNTKVVYDRTTVSVYSVAGSDWISYDDPGSVSDKVKYAKGHAKGHAKGPRLGGHFFWQVAGDYQWTLSKAASDSWKDSLQEI